MTEPAHGLSEAARLGILQGRFEALGQRARLVEPVHLVIGVLHTLDGAALEALSLTDAELAALCAQLGSGPEPATLSPGDIDYAPACHALVAAATAAAATPAHGDTVDPLHLLLGTHRVAPPLAAQLTGAGLTSERIVAALERQSGRRR